MRLGDEPEAWELEDAVERHNNAPDLYTVPTLAQRSSIRPGDQVQLLFLIRGHDRHGQFIQSERLWVTVREASPGSFKGALEMMPAGSVLLRLGDVVAFEARHVAAIKAKGE